jgi:AraC family transcriptional regulator of adaptative response / DNA-3-methyladenine glycosylase II
MHLDPDVCYLALKSRDSRFDGRFFTAVVTTGVYCRPVCPAPLPRRRNVRFFACAAAAEDAGFRPCLRCRPEASPGTPAWIGTSASVNRALRLISEGYLDTAGVDDLAERLGMGARHLRRLFITHLGASPIAVAKTRRVHFAKTLLDSTALPITEIAFCAGFSSIRRFNAIFRETFGRSPKQLRRGRHSGVDGGSSGCLGLRLPYRPPFDWQSLLGFLRPRAIPGVERVGESSYERTVRIGDVVGTIGVRNENTGRCLLLRIPAELSRYAPEITKRVRNLFDLRADPMSIESRLGRDPLLAAAVGKYPGLRIPGAWDGFETSVRAILGQQVSLKAATTIAGRIVKAYGEPFPDTTDSRLTHLFPGPERLSAVRFTGMGMPAGRTGAIRGLSRALRGGDLRLDGTVGLDEITERLTALNGIGPWTANYIAMRVCREPDAFPSGDLALRRAVMEQDRSCTSEAALLKRAEAWRPWRAYATMYLWTQYASKHDRPRKG